MALARALINRPAIVLADEPTGNLDSKNSEIVLDMLRHSNQELGQTVLMITHNPEAAAYGDRIIHMRDGEIVTPEKDPQWSGTLVSKQSPPELGMQGIDSCESTLSVLDAAVVGSFIICASSGSNSVVECDLAKVEVAGSNPVSRSNIFSPVPPVGLFSARTLV